MLIFAGLGNPGSQYARNRHNIGFMAIDAMAERYRFPAPRQRFQGRASEGDIGGEKVLLLEPQTYMNESGRSVAEALRFYKVAPKDVLVFHDELDLPAAKVRVKLGGGNAGHNGLKSITAHIGNDYKRVRLGIGHPGDKALVYNYVLGDFSKADMDWVRALCEILAAEAPLLSKGDDAAFQTRLHLAMSAKGFGEAKPAPGA